MFRKRKLTKIIAIFFLLEMVADIALPHAAMALTSGPTAPEATSFEPVDTTDMVNLATGDFVYNMPLLEVPGPSGGYPLSLSYHAGIMTNQEASWVGLGWTLNPGALNRTVSGFPDDYKNSIVTDRFFWEGGETHTGKIGVTYGISGVVGATAGIEVAHDTYRGVGVGGFVGINAGWKTGSVNVGVNATVGSSPFGGAYMSAGVSAGIGDAESGLSAGVGVGVTTNFESVNGYSGGGISMTSGENKPGELSRGSASLLGASLSTNQSSGIGVSAGGMNNNANRKIGKITTSGFNWVIPIPFIYLGYKYQRYWMDETDISYANGILFSPNNQESKEYFTDYTFDNYSILDAELPGGIIDHPDPNKILGGTFPDFDHTL